MGMVELVVMVMVMIVCNADDASGCDYGGGNNEGANEGGDFNDGSGDDDVSGGDDSNADGVSCSIVSGGHFAKYWGGEGAKFSTCMPLVSVWFTNSSFQNTNSSF